MNNSANKENGEKNEKNKLDKFIKANATKFILWIEMKMVFL